MRLINCSDCFSALRCSDDAMLHSERTLPKAGRHLRGLTRAIFQRRSTTPASTASPSWMCTKDNGTKTYGYADDWGDTDDPTRSSHRQFPIERKHKVKKRDLVKQLLIVEAGNLVPSGLDFVFSLSMFLSICFPSLVEWFHPYRFYRQIQFNFNMWILNVL